MAKVYGGKLNAISRGLKLHRADMKILRGVPSNEWTPIFDGLTTFGELYSSWQPSGNNWEVEVESYIPSSLANSGILSANTLLADGALFRRRDVLGNDVSAYYDGADHLSQEGVVGYINTKLDSSGELTVNSQSFANAIPSGWETKYIGRFVDTFFLDGQIQRIKLLDHDDPSNSIDINTVKRSKDAPLASDNLLINSLGSVGEELVVNGGWLGNGVSTITDNDGLLTIARNGGTFADQCYQDLPTSIGKSYVFNCAIVSETASTSIVIDGVAFGGFSGGVLPFIASTAVTRVSVNPAGVIVAVSTVDNISVRENTRNVGELVNLTGYELVNRGE